LDSKHVKPDLENFRLYDKEGKVHQLYRHKFWYMAPTLTDWEENVHFSALGFLLHNTNVGEGITPAMADLMQGIETKTSKNGNSRKAEEFLEQIRKDKYDSLPSRLNCHFLNPTREVAEERAKLWNWTSRRLEPCYLILSSGHYHYADIRKYESLAFNPTDIVAANSYWETFSPQTEADVCHLEILADSCLYFPNWETFRRLNQDTLQEYNSRQ
jgi:hypothetical protein